MDGKPIWSVRGLVRLVALLLCSSPLLWGATNETPDYGQALGMFASFGLPTLGPEARYGRFSVAGIASDSLQPISQLYRIRGVEEHGWVWDGIEDAGGVVHYAYLGGGGGRARAGESTGAATTQRTNAAPASTEGDRSRLPRLSWFGTGVDMSKDAEKVLAVLRRETSVDGGKHADFNDPFGESREEYSPLLLVAAHFYQAGLTNQANEITHLLLGETGDRSMMVRAAVVELAKLGYVSASMRLAEGGDWQRYRDDLQNLVDRFGAIWELVPGVERLIEKVDKRLEGQGPGSGALEPWIGEFWAGVSEADLQLLHHLGLDSILNPAVQVELLSAPESEAGKRFMGRGIHMLPGILAVAESDYLIPAGAVMGQGSSWGSPSYHSSRSGGLKTAEQLFGELTRKPASLGDAAMVLLRGLIPMNDQEERSAVNGGDSIRSNTIAAAQSFYDEHADDSPAELALYYLHEGSHQQQSTALGVLLKGADEATLAPVEAFVLSTNVWDDDGYSLLSSRAVSHLSTYIEQMPERAAERVPPLLDMIKAELPARLKDVEKDRRQYVVRSIKQMLKGLRDALDPAAAVVELDDSAEAFSVRLHNRMTDLMTQVTEMGAYEGVGCYLDAIVATEDPRLRAALLQSFYSNYQYRWKRMADAEDEEATSYVEALTLSDAFDVELFRDADYVKTVASRAQEKREAPALMAEREQPASEEVGAVETLLVLRFPKQWRALLADDRMPSPDPSEGAIDEDGSQTVGEAAASTLAACVMDMDDLDPEQLVAMQSLGPRLKPYWRAVAVALLDGVAQADLPAMPSASNVSEADAELLIQRALKTPSGEMPAFIDGLDVDSLLVVGGCSVTNPALGKVLAPAANLITEVAAHSVSNYAGSLVPFVGQSISSNLFEELLCVVTSLATQSVPAVVELKRGPWMSGTVLSIVTNMAPDNVYRGEYEFDDPFAVYPSVSFGAAAGKAQIAVFSQSTEDYQVATWTVEIPVADTNLQATGEASSEETKMASLMSRLGVSVEGGDVSKEMLEKMAEAMAGSSFSRIGGDSQMEQQQKVREAIEKINAGTISPLAEFVLRLTIQLPKGEQESEEADEIDDMLELNLEEI